MSQEGFAKLVREYNEEYLALLQRASQRDYQPLLLSFSRLKDVYDVIQLLLNRNASELQVLPYPFWFRGNRTFLGILGFSSQQIQNIFGFLDYVKLTHGKIFEDCFGIATKG
jgi:hypothetical protein